MAVAGETQVITDLNIYRQGRTGTSLHADYCNYRLRGAFGRFKKADFTAGWEKEFRTMMTRDLSFVNENKWFEKILIVSSGLMCVKTMRVA